MLQHWKNSKSICPLLYSYLKGYSSVKYKIIPVTSFQQNCTLLMSEQTDEALLVDPGGDVDTIYSAVEHANRKISKILLTHGHFDHISAAKVVAEYYNAPIWGPHADDQFLFDTLPEFCKLYEFPVVAPFLPDKWLNDGELIPFVESHIQVLHCPGHTPGHVVYYLPDDKLILTGDVLFKDSIGRTDFPRGDYSSLISSIKNKLLLLGDEIQFIPGHGPMSTLGDEKTHNPYLQQ